jgi:hypothetical protein
MKKTLYAINVLYKKVLMNLSSITYQALLPQVFRFVLFFVSLAKTFTKGQTTPGPHKLHTAIFFSLLPAHHQSKTVR